MSKRCPDLAAAFVLALILAPVPGEAKPKIGENGIDRPTAHTAWWCPSTSYGSFSFVADGPDLEIVFTARVVSEENGGNLDQRLDNVCILPTSVHDANLVTVEDDPDLLCTSFGGDTWLNIDAVDPGDIVFLDRFHTGLDAAWDQNGDIVFADSAYVAGQPSMNPPASAPNDFLDPEANPTGGSLAFLAGAVDSFRTTSLNVTGLTAGVEYTFSFWWKANADFFTYGDLTLEFYGTEVFVDVSPMNPGWANQVLGAAWGDHDRDGDPDLFVTRTFGFANRLYRNDAGVLVEGTPAPLTNNTDNGAMSVWGDADGNGWPDLYLINGGVANRLYSNVSGVFTDVTAPPVDQATTARGGTWLDYDLDGDIDLYVVNDGVPCRLYRNEGGFSFTDVTPALLAGPPRAQMPAACDFDNDGDQDLFVTDASGGDHSHLYRNDGGGAWTDVTPTNVTGAGRATAAAWGDPDCDGDFDLFLGTFDGDNRLFENVGGTLVDATPAVMLDDTRAYTPVWFDFDNDADEDLFLTVENEEDRLFRNDGPAGFVRLLSDMDVSNAGRAAAPADIDGDGDLDVFAASLGTPFARLYRNDYAHGGDWIQVSLDPTVSNPSALGARVEVTAGGKTQIREVFSNQGWGSQRDPKLHFGLGTLAALGTVDLIRVRWPSGIVQDLTDAPINQCHEIVEDPASVSVADAAPRPGPVSAAPNPFRARTTIRFDAGEAADVRLEVFDLRGRLVRVLLDRASMSGPGQVSWDGRDIAGRRMPGGVYLYRLTAGAGPEVGRVVLLPN